MRLLTTTLMYFFKNSFSFQYLGEVITLQPGIHTYNFSCRIPNNCPSSFEGAYGHIRYVIKVVLLRPWQRDLTFNKAFTVLKVLDLNYETPLVKVSELELQFYISFPEYRVKTMLSRGNDCKSTFHFLTKVIPLHV